LSFRATFFNSVILFFISQTLPSPLGEGGFCEFASKRRKRIKRPNTRPFVIPSAAEGSMHAVPHIPIIRQPFKPSPLGEGVGIADGRGLTKHIFPFGKFFMAPHIFRHPERSRGIQALRATPSNAEPAHSIIGHIISHI